MRINIKEKTITEPKFSRRPASLNDAGLFYALPQEQEAKLLLKDLCRQMEWSITAEQLVRELQSSYRSLKDRG